jgi:hypothetical protein
MMLQNGMLMLGLGQSLNGYVSIYITIYFLALFSVIFYIPFFSKSLVIHTCLKKMQYSVNKQTVAEQFGVER